MSSEIVIKFLVAAVLAGTPFLFGTVGEILSEKVGHLNLGVEGMMSIGACAGFMVGYQTDNFVAALLAAAVAGMLSALIYGVLGRAASIHAWNELVAIAFMSYF